MSLTEREIRNIKARQRYKENPEKYKAKSRERYKKEGKEIYQRRKLREAGLVEPYSNRKPAGTHSKTQARDLIANANKIFIVGNAIIIE